MFNTKKPCRCNNKSHKDYSSESLDDIECWEASTRDLLHMSERS